ncbi:ACT domain-containing protein [Haloactinopolyspora sp.]|uniref:ACT domain-containing protein n=1 Tax=Haloactinopolyspora sp. TaxID=1966353 RepID=UPI0026270DA6|nr:ACT domain-containing protein [Haloactinopolyspora sp.]
MSARTLHEHPGDLAVCRLPAGAEAPDWATTHPAPIVSLTYTADETSLVCAASAVPSGVPHEGPFTSFSVAGPLDFTLTGVLAGLLQPLAEAEISVFTLSTHDTDWILVPAGRSGAAKEALRRRGHVVVDQS